MNIDLRNNDCLIECNNIKDYSIDLILTDLPYGTTACAWDSIIDLEKMWKQFYRVLRPNGFIVLTASQPFTSKLVMSNINNFSHNWVWNKKRGVGHLLAKKRPMMASEDILVFSNEHSHDFTFRSPLRKYAIKLFDYIGKTKKQIFKDIGNQCIDHFMRTKSTQFNICTKKCYNRLIKLYNIDKMNGFIEYDILRKENDNYLNSFKRVYNPQMRERETPRLSKMKASHKTVYGNLSDFEGNILDEIYPINIIEFEKSNQEDMKYHNTQKPILLLEYLIRTFSNENDFIFDATMGSGSTAIACMNTNRNFIGIELDKHYFAIAKKRVEEKRKEKENEQQTLFVDTN